MRTTKAIALGLAGAAVYSAFKRASPHVQAEVRIASQKAQVELRGQLNAPSPLFEKAPEAKTEAVENLGFPKTPDNALDRLEHELTPTGAALTFMAAVVIMVCGAFAYVVTGAKVKEVFDYLAYVSPCIAALAAGLTIYFDRYKGTLFAVSIIFLSLGLEMFAASKENDAVPVGVISVVAMIAMNLAITLLRLG